MQVVGKDIQHFQETVRDHSDYDFSQYSHTSLRRRLTRILLEMDLEMEEITERMINDPVFLESVVKKLTVHTTELFRDPVIWKKIKSTLLPTLKNQSSVKIWHPGCSTGQEVYSMMILLHEMGLLQKSQIYGTDINEDVLTAAREGVYKYRFNEGYLTNFDAVIKENPRDSDSYFDVPYSKYFHIDKTRDNIRMNKSLIDKPVYRKQDLVRDPNPFDEKYDLIICRNVIIYFNYELQNKVFKLFLDNMNQGGCLVLGVHESILGPFASRFDKKSQVYVKK